MNHECCLFCEAKIREQETECYNCGASYEEIAETNKANKSIYGDWPSEDIVMEYKFRFGLDPGEFGLTEATMIVELIQNDLDREESYEESIDSS